MKARGFTLIEVLLAMMLLSIVMYIGSFSFSVFSERWQKELGGFNSHVSEARKLLLLRQLLKGTANYLVQDEENNNAIYLFYGDARQLVFVTNNPLFEPEVQALVRLTVNTLDNGQQQLLYSEYSFASSPVYNSAPLPEPGRTIVLLQSENIRFNYFGWESAAARDDYLESFTGKPSWQSEFNARAGGMLPYAVNLTWAQNEPMIFPLQNDNRFKTIYVRQEDSYDN